MDIGLSQMSSKINVTLQISHLNMKQYQRLRLYLNPTISSDWSLFNEGRARAVNETTAHERFLDTLSDGAMLDHEYVLYASQRIIGQRDAGSSMGQDDISALQLLEFEMKFNKIKKLHRSCILALKAFWQIFCTHKRVFRKKAKYSEHLVDKVDDIVSCLQRIERASEGASEGYKALLDKFPRSVPLLHSYGSFCDVILNRAIQARQLMNSALLLESGPEEDVSSYAGQGHTLMHTLAIGDEENRQADQTAVKSTSSSSDGNHRARIDRFIASWKDVIMAKELADLRRLNWRILFATLMILVVCTIGFVLMDSVLYESTAHANIDLVDGSQLFRVNLFQSLFLIHSLVLADISNNTVEAASIQSHLNIISQGFAAAHLQSFQKATADVGDLYKSQTWQLFSPTGWITSFHSLWFLGNEFSSQVASASGMPTSEAAMWNNDITNLSPAMRAIVFLNENCFQNILPAFEQLGQAYIAQVVKFGQLTRTVIWISVSLNVILILLVAIYILRSLGSVVNNVQHDIVIMLLVLSTSRTSASKILAFYDRAERTIMDIDAEDENFVKLSTEDDELLATTTAGEDNRHNRDEMVVGDKSSNCFGETMSQHKNLMDFPMIDKSGTHMSGTHMRISDDEIQAVPERNEFQGIRSIDIQQHPVLAIVSERLVCNNMKNNMNNNNMVKSSSSNSLVPEQRNHAALRIQSAPKSIQALRTLTAQKCPWYVRRPVHFVSLAVMLFLCIISVLYPARNVDDLVNIPAKQNQAGRRRFLHLACVHFARELVLYDGFSRLNAPELVAALQWSLYELRESDKAVRLGGTLGVIKGSEAGLGRTDHNSFVYSTGCPWRTNYSEGSFCSVQSRPNMLMHGLDGLMLTFYDACESILAKNLPEVLGNYLRFPQNFTQGTIQAEVNKANLDLLSSDPDAAFIMESFSGDLYQALEQVESIMKIEQDGIFNLFHSEGRLLYGVFVAQTCLLFYLVIFRKSILSCEKEIAKIKQFVQRLPAFLLEMQEAEEIHFFFKEREYARNQREDDENHVDLDLG
uniref:TmcB/TmcC TPR repeats domain-containing protein n=1 Tax=Cryptomonas curvata TaxID=233186 RepID=A0A7S0MTS2_9CRYP|mmetsp:Transcript_54141/g.113174  ORF Transcript_54141/g.113174 Transcript_54141/m.113174 type:complete len:1035 (+) Transcript_54141:179-3283(+)